MRILLVEDSLRLQASIGKALRKSGYAVDASGDGENGLWLAESNDYDAVILDIMLPKLDGLALLRRLRKKGRQTPILLLTARDTVEDRVTGLQTGADDYLVKPFDPDELLSRVRAVLRRIAGSRYQIDAVTRFGEIRVDANRREVWRGNHLIDLTAMEFDIFDLLARSAGRIVSRQEITEVLFDRKATASDRSLDVHVSRLRKKLESGHTLIRTIRGVGYVFASVESR